MARVVTCLAIGLSLFQLYTVFAAPTALVQRGIHVGAILALAFLTKGARKERTKPWLAVDIGLAAVARGADPGEVVHGKLGARLDEAVREFPGIDFSGSVLCARDGVVYLARGYGFART